MKYVASLIAVYCACFNIASAENPNKIDGEWENLSGAYAQCAAYYRLVHFAMKSSGEVETAQAYRSLEDNSMLYALALANNGRSKEMALKVTNSRIEMYLSQMKSEAENRNENISVLINAYHSECKQLQEKPPKAVIDALAKVAG